MRARTLVPIGAFALLVVLARYFLARLLMDEGACRPAVAVVLEEVSTNFGGIGIHFVGTIPGDPCYIGYDLVQRLKVALRLRTKSERQRVSWLVPHLKLDKAGA